MLMVKTKLGLSAIEGIGLFADEDIQAGTVTWRFIPGFDQLFLQSDIGKLPDAARAQIANYTYLHAPTGAYVFCIDNARFMNHADIPNTDGVHAADAIEGYDVATRDIAKGEELTCDYRRFDADFGKKLVSN